MEIAPGFTADAWRGLALGDPAHPDWNHAVGVLRHRLWARYVDPVDALIAAEPVEPRQRTIGFTVLAIDCLLVEAYASFRWGLLTTERMSRRVFKTFLSTRTRFRGFFDRARADRFYFDYRCGILHQAEIPPQCRIWSVGPLWREDANVTYVNRTVFHHELKADLEEYFSHLRDPNHARLRSNFRRKMDGLAREI